MLISVFIHTQNKRYNSFHLRNKQKNLSEQKAQDAVDILT